MTGPQTWLDLPTRSIGLSATFALARYWDHGVTRVGIVREDRIRVLPFEEIGVAGLNDLLGRADAWKLVAAAASDQEAEWVPLADVTLTAPVEPRHVIQAGANYRQHVIDLVVAHESPDSGRTHEEARAFATDLMDKRAREGTPYFFIGFPSCVVGDDVDLQLPAYSSQHDWELELAVVIGEPGFRIDRDDAMRHVAGYTISNDITTRDLVFVKEMKELGTDWFRAKNAPGFLPTGPFLVPAMFVPDPAALTVHLELNGDTMQEASTSDLLFDIPALIAAASETCPLLPGDLILTGSPAGNGAHWGRLLRDGDTMVGSISGLGTQVVHCIDGAVAP